MVSDLTLPNIDVTLFLSWPIPLQLNWVWWDLGPKSMSHLSIGDKTRVLGSGLNSFQSINSGLAGLQGPVLPAIRAFRVAVVDDHHIVHSIWDRLRGLRCILICIAVLEKVQRRLFVLDSLHGKTCRGCRTWAERNWPNVSVVKVNAAGISLMSHKKTQETGILCQAHQEWSDRPTAFFGFEKSVSLRPNRHNAILNKRLVFSLSDKGVACLGSMRWNSWNRWFVG